jgi:hypothetical protein
VTGISGDDRVNDVIDELSMLTDTVMTQAAIKDFAARYAPAWRQVLSEFEAAAEQRGYDRGRASADVDAQPCTTCEESTGNPDTFCDACKLNDLEEDCDRLRGQLVVANDQIRSLCAEAESQLAEIRSAEQRGREAAYAAIDRLPRRSGTPEWSSHRAETQAAGYDMGLAAARDAVISITLKEVAGVESSQG